MNQPAPATPALVLCSILRARVVPLAVVLAAVLLVAGSIAAAPIAAAAPNWRDPAEIPSMQGMAVNWISRKMRYNSVPMNIRLFSTDAEVEAVQDYYQSWFGNRGTGNYVVSEADGYLILGASVSGSYHTVKLKTLDGKTVGSLTTSVEPRLVDRQQAKLEPIFHYTSMAELMNRVESVDDGTYADVSTFAFSASTDYASQWVSDTLTRDGWRQSKLAGQDAAVSQYQRGSEQAQVSVVSHPSGRNDRSIVTVVWVNRS